MTTPLLISVAGVASAQDIHPFSVRGGWSYLTNKDSRDATNNSGYTIGASYDIQPKYLGGMGGSSNNRFSIDVDWDSHRGNGNLMESGALQLVVRSNISGMGMGAVQKGGTNLYLGAGLG